MQWDRRISCGVLWHKTSFTQNPVSQNMESILKLFIIISSLKKPLSSLSSKDIF
jgi:hypothetical protein